MSAPVLPDRVCDVCGGTDWDVSCDFFSDHPVHFDVCVECGFAHSLSVPAAEWRLIWLDRKRVAEQEAA